MAIIYAPIPQRRHWDLPKRVCFTSETIFSSETAVSVDDSKHTEIPGRKLSHKAYRRTKPQDYGFRWAIGERLPTKPKGPRPHPPKSILKKSDGSVLGIGDFVASPEGPSGKSHETTTAHMPKHDGEYRASEEGPTGPSIEPEKPKELAEHHQRRRDGRTDVLKEYTFYGQRSPPLSPYTIEYYRRREEEDKKAIKEMTERRTEKLIGPRGIVVQGKSSHRKRSYRFW